MDFRHSSSAFVLRLGWRTLGAASLAFLLLNVVATTHYYATAVVLALIVLFILLDAGRMYKSATVAGDAIRPATYHSQAEQLDRTTALLDAVTVALIVLDPDGRITFANRAARQLTGAAAGRLYELAVLGPDATRTIAALPVGARQIVGIPDGRRLLVWVGGFSVPSAPIQKLVSLQTVAGELDAVQVEAWHDMTRVLSHEITNALTPVASLSESLSGLLAKSDRSDSDCAEAAATIARRSRHLISFVERYRQVAELPRPQRRILSGGTLVRDIDRLMMAKCMTNGVNYVSTIIPDDLVLFADPEMLSQAILNLLHNAVEAVSGAKAPTVSLCCRQDGYNVLLTVSDNGVGIAPDHIDEIFVPFFTTKQGGTGIGLALSRQVALAHGGRITVQRGAGVGSIFTIILPGNKPD